MYTDYLAYIGELEKICKKKYHRLVSLGIISGLPLYMVVTGNRRSKNTICISAGIHGNEDSGPLGILEFLKNYKTNNNDPKIIFFPVANPTGFHEDTYLSSDGKNLNRYFDKKNSAVENQLLIKSISNEPISFFLSLHEDDELSGAYIYGYFDGKKTPLIYKEIIETLRNTCPIYEKNRIYNYKSMNGIVLNPLPDGSFESQMHLDGIKYSVCLEIPDRLPISKRIEANLRVIDKAIKFCRNFIV